MTFLNPEFTHDKFLNDVKNHSLKILHDDGVYRHLEFSNNGSNFYKFNLTTWPGYLCFSGDMGDYTFRRVEDMFTFFRKEEPAYAYWSQKVQAEDRHSKVKKFTSAAFKMVVLDILSETRKQVVDEAEDLNLYNNWESKIKTDLDVYNYESEYEANDLIERWDESSNNNLWTQVFEDFWVNHAPIEEFSYHFMWACHAIVFGITAYDKVKAENIA